MEVGVLAVLIFLQVFKIMCQHSTLLWNSSMNCEEIIERSEWKSHKICNISHVKACKKHMHR
jgi:hypothetical protein